MEITVRLFATLRQIAGWASQPLEVIEGATLREALAEIDARYPQAVKCVEMWRNTDGEGSPLGRH